MKGFSVILALAVLLPAGGVSAAEVFNVNTGADSVNETSIKIENEGEYKIENKADIKNEIMVSAATGGNEASENTGGDEEELEENNEAGTITTGDANISVRLENIVNQTTADIDNCCDGNGRGGGEENPPEPFIPDGDGRGGGGELALAESPVLEGFGGGGELPGAGAETLVWGFAAAALVTIALRLRELRLKKLA